MPLDVVPARHMRVGCNGCGVDAHLCLGPAENELAVKRFKAAGWTLDTATGGRSRGSEYAERHGNGNWYSRACSVKRTA
jgi:hypothetical protein